MLLDRADATHLDTQTLLPRAHIRLLSSPAWTLGRMPDHCLPRNFEFEREVPWVRLVFAACFDLDAHHHGSSSVPRVAAPSCRTLRGRCRS